MRGKRTAWDLPPTSPSLHEVLRTTADERGDLPGLCRPDSSTPPRTDVPKCSARRLAFLLPKRRPPPFQAVEISPSSGCFVRGPAPPLEPANHRSRQVAVGTPGESRWLPRSRMVRIYALRWSEATLGQYRASFPTSPVRMRTTSSTGNTKILPSPIFPVRHTD